MGRGDKKTKKGKIFKGSFGKSRLARPIKVKPTEEKKEAQSICDWCVGFYNYTHNVNMHTFKT